MATEHDNPERDRQVADLLRTVAESERAPESLHARVSAMRAQRNSAPRAARLLRRPALSLVRLAMPAAAAGAAALVLVLGGGAGAPSIAQAAALSTRAPTAPAPQTDPSDPGKLLTARVGSLHFPNWQAAGGWRPVGQRFDHLGNRTATTVYYQAGGERVVYSILSSPTLSMKHGQPRYAYAATLSRQGRTTVVWAESGHTCLLTGPEGMSAAQLWRLAFYGFRQPLAAG